MMIEFSEHERNVILMLQSYEDGVQIEIMKFRDDVLNTLRDLTKRGFCIFDELPDQRAQIGLTDKGWEAGERIVQANFS